MLFWFRNSPFIEYMFYDVTGQIQSEVFRLDFNILTIRYYAGQLLVFQALINGETTFYYMFSDFGVKKINFETVKPKKMPSFGKFVNGFVHPHSGELMIELIDNQTLTDLSWDRQLKEFVVEYSKRLIYPGETASSNNTRIFEMSGEF